MIAKIPLVSTNKSERGFTIIEVVSSIFIISVFVVVISQLYILQTQVAGEWLQFEKAEQIAYNNLDKYARYAAAQTNSCTDYPTATSEKQLLSQTTQVGGLPGPVVQSVAASMPYGCNSNLLSDGFPIKIVSSVTYGPSSKKSTYATYVNAGG